MIERQTASRLQLYISVLFCWRVIVFIATFGQQRASTCSLSSWSTWTKCRCSHLRPRFARHLKHVNTLDSILALIDFHILYSDSALDATKAWILIFAFPLHQKQTVAFKVCSCIHIKHICVLNRYVSMFGTAQRTCEWFEPRYKSLWKLLVVVQCSANVSIEVFVEHLCIFLTCNAPHNTYLHECLHQASAAELQGLCKASEPLSPAQQPLGFVPTSPCAHLYTPSRESCNIFRIRDLHLLLHRFP